MTFLIALIVAAGLFFASITIILLLIGPTLLLRPRRRTAVYYKALGLPVTPSELALPYELIKIPVETDIILDGWLIKGRPPVRGTILYLHGVGDCKIDGIRPAKLFYDQHYNVCLFDARRHGASGGKFCTYGFFEKFDVIRILDFLERRTDLIVGPLGIFGTSMGAAVALQAASIDPRIRAVVAENSFATLRSIFDDYQKRMIRLPLHYLRNIVIVRSEFLADFKASEVSPLEAVTSITVPILFVYGSEDHLINCKYSIQLYNASAGAKQIYPIAGASHNDTWFVGGKEYESKIISFFEKNLV